MKRLGKPLFRMKTFILFFVFCFCFFFCFSYFFNVFHLHLNKHSVDSLLQIHAIFNMLDIDTTIGAEERKVYEEELIQLEAKFLGKNVNLVKNCQLEQRKWEQKADEIQSNLIANEYQWCELLLYANYKLWCNINYCNYSVAGG